MPDASGYFTYSEWEKWAVDKITAIGTGRMKLTDEKYREDYLRVQIAAVIRQALRRGRSGRGDDDPVSP
jgi:hypothetical protein